MQDYDISTIWFISGIVLMVLEFLVPGGIVFFLGLSATIVALLLYIGLIEGWLQAFSVWFIGSLVLLFSLRGVVHKLLPSQRERSKTDEDLDAYNLPAEVVERIPAKGEGRIAFRGSTWVARSVHDDQDLEAETAVRIVYRDNLVWMVEALDNSDAHQQDP